MTFEKMEKKLKLEAALFQRWKRPRKHLSL